ncbi:MAG: arylesterase [Gammaproteobacteria bacterium RIFCSPLOWO2_02_FULL_61_13]|nr:MAG: arylesterase [Gammaproteobacteria bacterium RIFCSPLOWO2_02_FULL_61_13]
MIRVLVCMLLCLPVATRAGEGILLILGDSLSAGYGMRVEQGWVALLAQRITAQGYPHRVVNASISGDTSHGGLARLGPLLAEARPQFTVVELGGNDGLRGVPLDELRRNLGEILTQVCAAGSDVLLLPMKLPPNYGPAYTQGFEQIYRDLAAEHGVLLGLFILEDIALKPDLMQSDGIHPAAEAQPIILDRIWPLIVSALSGETRVQSQ